MKLASEDPVETGEHWLSLHHLSQRQYWSRCWCIQEVVSAKKDPILVCGDTKVSLGEFLF